jgi:hypothetical protein
MLPFQYGNRRFEGHRITGPWVVAPSSTWLLLRAVYKGITLLRALAGELILAHTRSAAPLLWSPWCTKVHEHSPLLIPEASPRL